MLYNPLGKWGIRIYELSVALPGPVKLHWFCEYSVAPMELLLVITYTGCTLPGPFTLKLACKFIEQLFVKRVSAF